MDFDIDIEEHNVLENPALRAIFPDITALKQELFDYDNEDTIQNNELEEMAIGDQAVGLHNTKESHQVAEPSYLVSSKKIGLDLKFNRQKNELTQKPNVHIANQDIIFCNKIILGSKPKKNNNIIHKNISKQAIIVLSDVSPILKGCKKFCKVCLILFPKEDRLIDHKKNVHSEKYICKECDKSFYQQGNLNRHIRNIHKCKIELNNRTKITNIKKSEGKVNDHTSKGKVEEPFRKRKVKEPTSIGKAKYTTSKDKVKDPTSKDKVKDPTSKDKVKDPTSKDKVKYTTSKEKVKDPTSKGKVKEPTNKGKLEESTVKGKKTVAKVSCFHCSDKFDSKQLLIEHLYAVLEPKFINKINFPKSNNKSLNKADFIPEDVNKMDLTETLKKGQETNDDTTIQMLNKPINKIQTQSYFKCQKCSHYFKDEKLFSKHMIRKHRIRNFLNTRVKFNSKCEFCNHNCINFRMYNRHLHNHHRISLMQKLKNSKSKGISVRKQYNRILTKAKRKNILIPKSTVFKCSKCEIYFISPNLALNHTEHIQNYNWKCNECNFIFKKNEAYFHMRQHGHAKTFKVINICDEILSKLLYCCPKCTIHYQEENFILHYTSCGTSTPQSEYCISCDILIDSKIKATHINIHNVGNNNDADFFIMDLLDNVKDKNKLYLERRRKLNFNIDEQNLHLYYCNTCKCFVSTLYKVSIHRESNCTQLLRSPCRFCGLILTGKAIMSHRSMHYNNKSLKLQDFTIYNLDTGKRICPPIPEFSKCEGCNIHLLNKNDIRRHVCGKDVDVVCLLCEMKFSETVYKIHLEFHNYVLDSRKSKGEPTVKEKSISVSYTPKISKSEEQVNIDKAIHFENTTDVSDLYCCKICSVHLETYDKVIEHCQLHLSCVDIDEKTERNLQCNNIEFKKPSKNIFYFEPFYFGSKNEIWLQHVFNGLTSEDINNKLSNSIYRYESRIKLQLCQEGNPEFTEYKCDTCQCFVNCLSLFSHIDGCITNPRKYSCIVCKLPFISKLALSKHFQMHKMLSHVNNVCRIVSFNRDIDKEINTLIKSNPSRPYVVYKCRNCEGLVHRNEFSSHICNNSDLKKCCYCGLLLYSIDYESHVIKHKKLNSFTGNNMKVILLGFKILDANKIINSVSNSFMGIVCDYSFYKCSKCDVCIRDFRCISKHFCLVDAAKAKCKYCDLYFDEGKIKGHIKLHTDDQDFIKNNIITVDFDPNTVIEKRHNESAPVKDQIDVKCIGKDEDVGESNIIEKIAIIYRCAKCNLHYLNKSSANEHARKRPGRVVKQFCTKCGFSFSPNVLFHHLLEHHGNKNIKYKFEVVDVFGNFKKQIICKCNKCNLHFLNSKKMLEHYSGCLGDSAQGGKCKCCGLNMHYSYLLDHEKYSEKNAHVDYVIADAESAVVNNTF